MKRIVIMGATSGIGRVVAETFARAGWQVGAAGRNENALKELKAAYPEAVHYARIDVTADDAAHHLRSLIDRLGGMDIYFHASGIFIEDETLKPESEIATLQTNVVGFARMVSAAFRYFRDHAVEGQIAAITSIAGTKGIGRMADYSSSKKFQQTYLTALDQLARNKGYKIAITDIRPGWTQTPLVRSDRRYPMIMDVDDVARQTIHAILQRRRMKIVDWRWNIVTRLWSLLPDRLWERLNVPLWQDAEPEKQAAVKASGREAETAEE